MAQKKGIEIALPGGGSKNSVTGKVTPPKVKATPTPKATGTAAMNGSQYDKYLQGIVNSMNKGKKK
jgi:hypothetical protein